MYTGEQAEISEAVLGSHRTGWTGFRHMQNGFTCAKLSQDTVQLQSVNFPCELENISINQTFYF